MAVTWEGEVYPSAPTGFGTPSPTAVPSIDADGDNVVDWLDGTGNDIFFGAINPNDPDDSDAGAGLRWNHADVWRDYDSTDKLRVGKRHWGRLTINGGSALRYAGVEIGERGHGATIVTGAGSILNLDPTVHAAGVIVALNLGIGGGRQGSPASSTGRETLIENLAGTDGSGNNIVATTSPAFALTARSVTAEYDCLVGEHGQAELQIDSGGTVVVRSRLLVGEAATGTGLVWVDGPNSLLLVNGFRASGELSRQSVLGASGRGELRVTFGGSALIRGGLKITEGSLCTLAGGTLQLQDLAAPTGTNSGETSWTDLAAPTGLGTLVNDGVLVVRASSSSAFGYPSVLAANVTNNGTIYVEPGATLVVKGEMTGSGELVYDDCRPRAIVTGLPGVPALAG